MTDGFFHQRPDRIVLVFRNNADVGCDDAGSEFHRDIGEAAEDFRAHHAFGFDVEGIAAEVTADGGNLKTFFRALFPDGFQFRIRIFQPVHPQAELNTLKAHFRVDFQRFAQRLLQRICESSDFHEKFPFSDFRLLKNCPSGVTVHREQKKQMDKNRMIDDKKTSCFVFEKPDVPMPEINRQYGLWLFRGGSSLVSPEDSYQRSTVRIFEFYSISHLFRGHGKLWLENGFETEMRTGDCVIITPGTRNIYGGFHDVYEEDTINFLGPVADMLMRAGVISNGIFPFGNVRRLLPLMELLRDPAANSQIQANIEFQKLLVDLYLAKCSRREEDYPLLERLLIELKENPRRWWTVREMAEMCNLSDDQLRRIFLRRTGVAPKLYADRLKLNQAASLLTDSEKSVAEIAAEFGYMDQYHFSRRFKAVMGMSPTRYRSQAKTH